MMKKINQEYLLDKKLKKVKEPEFIIMNENCQCYSGLKRGYPAFSDDLDDARPLTNMEQFKKIQYGTSHNLEIIYV
jgi:hypothetical protein